MLVIGLAFNMAATLGMTVVESTEKTGLRSPISIRMIFDTVSSDVDYKINTGTV